MKIIQDTREQTPLEFPYEFVSEVKIEKLPVGDYTCVYEDGYRVPIIFERKSISDLFGTLGRGYKRFKNEIMLAKTLGIRLVLIIEKPLGTVLKGYEKSDLSGESVIRKLFTLMVKYDVFPVFCKDREEMSRYIYEFYCSIGRLMKKGKYNNAKLPSVSRAGDIQIGGEQGRGNSGGVDL